MKSAKMSEIARSMIESDKVLSAFKEPVDFQLLGGEEYIRARTCISNVMDTINIDVDISLHRYKYDIYGDDWKILLSEMVISHEATVSTVLFAAMKLAYKAGNPVRCIPAKLAPYVEHARELFNNWESHVHNDAMEGFLQKKVEQIRNAETKYAEEAEKAQNKHNTFMLVEYLVCKE